MQVRTDRDLGLLIRDRRKELGLGQAALAANVGVSRQWIVGVEKGRPRAEVGLVLRTLRVLGVELNATFAGSPASNQIAALLRAHSSRLVEDVQVFVDALVFNWLVAGTDAHAKNYSLLQGGGGRVRLAPLYDVASLLPYDQFDSYCARLAMKVGGKYRLRDIGIGQWRKLAATMELDPDQVVGRVARMTELLP